MGAITSDTQIRRNQRRMLAITATAALLLWLLLTLFIAPIGIFFDHHFLRETVYSALIAGGATALLIAINVASAPDHLLDRIGATVVDPNEHRELYDLCAELSIATGVPGVRAALIEERAPNAIAIGRSRSSTTVALTTGLVELLPRDQVEAVLAVELAAVALNEVAVGTVALACLGETVELADSMLNIGRDGPSILACVLALPFRGVSSILQRLVVLHRTSGADLFAVETTRNPAALIGALETIRAHPTDVVRVVVADSDLWFTFPRPVHGTGGTQSARPTLAERIRAIEAAYGISAASQSGA